MVPIKITKGNRHKLKHRKLHLNRKILTVRVMDYWNMLLTEVVESLSLEMFSIQVNIVLNNLQ